MNRLEHVMQAPERSMKTRSVLVPRVTFLVPTLRPALALVAIIAGGLLNGCSHAPAQGANTATAEGSKPYVDPNASKSLLDQLEALPPAQRAAFVDAHESELNSNTNDPAFQARFKQLMAAH